MDQYNIQINKTSRNSILFMTSIGTTRGSVAYLMNTLLQIAETLDEEYPAMNKKEKEILENRIHSLMEDEPPLPDFSRFHSVFQAVHSVPYGKFVRLTSWPTRLIIANIFSLKRVQTSLKAAGNLCPLFL